jgi:hypothetical protein
MTFPLKITSGSSLQKHFFAREPFYPRLRGEFHLASHVRVKEPGK